MQASTEPDLKSSSLEKAKCRLMDSIGIHIHLHQDDRGDGVSKDDQSFGRTNKKLSWIVTTLRVAKVKSCVCAIPRSNSFE